MGFFFLLLLHPLKRNLIFAKHIHTHYYLGFYTIPYWQDTTFIVLYNLFIPPNLSLYLFPPSCFVFPFYLPCVLSTRKSKAARQFPAWQSIFLCLTLRCSIFRQLATPDVKKSFLGEGTLQIRCCFSLYMIRSLFLKIPEDWEGRGQGPIYDLS